MLENHMIGITPAMHWPDMELLRDLGVEWVRLGIGMPFSDGRGSVSAKFMGHLEYLQRWRDQGFRIVASTPGPGSYRYVESSGKTEWSTWLPDWMGGYDDDSFYDYLGEGFAKAAELAKGIVDWYQVANEPDIDIFKGPLTDEQMDRFLLASARGVMQGNPQAQTGLNIGFITDDSRALLKRLYCRPDSPFGYLGIDGYFGSWQPGGPGSWPAYIDEVHALTGRPIIINEWGYSSLDRAPFTRDPERKERYNQGVCRAKAWDRVWKREHSREEQAEYVTECLRIFADHPAVIGNFFFRWGDTETCWQCGEPDCPAECAWGLVDVQQKPKPAYYALRDGIRGILTRTQPSP